MPLPQHEGADRALRDVVRIGVKPDQSAVFCCLSLADQPTHWRTRIGAIQLARHAAGKEKRRPASTAFFHGAGHQHRILAWAIAVFIRTPSQPSSSIAASDAVPTPASTSTGALLCSIIRHQIPRIEDTCHAGPISEASGMMAQQPISSSCLAIIGSSEV